MMNGRPYESEAVRAVTGQTIRPGELNLTRRAAEFCRLGPGDRIVDVGCGTGATVAFLNSRCDARAIGLDLSAVLLAESRNQWPGLNLINADAMALPLKKARVRAIYCECVCSLLTDAASALRGFYHALQPGGHLIVADLYWRTKDGAIPSLTAAGGCLKGAVDRQTMVQRIETAGFEVDLWEDHSTALKQLAARMVWAGLSLRQWWGVDCTQGICREDLRPGYCLIIAHKKERDGG